MATAVLEETGTAPRASDRDGDRMRAESGSVRVVSANVPLFRRLAALWSRRELYGFLVRKELSVKYKNSTLGFIWSMLNPALLLGVYFVVFQLVMKSGVPDFAIYLMCGLVVWNLFFAAVQTGTTAVVENSGIVKTVAFPREILAIAKVGQAAVFFALQLAVLAMVMAAMRLQPDWKALWLLVLAFAALVVVSAAIGVVLSALNVFYRDIQHLVDVLLMVWFWAAPIVYSYAGQIMRRLQPHHLEWLRIPYLADPVAPIVLTFQRVIYGRGNPQISHGGGPVLPAWGLGWYAAADAAVLVAGILALAGAIVLFGRMEANFAEEL